jgi:hypothetical protein
MLAELTAPQVGNLRYLTTRREDALLRDDEGNR